jgi:DNA-binding response OmpR family regulator
MVPFSHSLYPITIPLKIDKKMKKILIVDDEPNIVMSLEYTFKKQNFEVFIARDGQETLDILKIQLPDIIILDVMMPMVDGFATLEHIKKEERLKHCKVIFLSAKNKEKDIEKGLSLGANLYVLKPFSVKKLVEQVNELL